MQLWTLLLNLPLYETSNAVWCVLLCQALHTEFICRLLWHSIRYHTILRWGCMFSKHFWFVHRFTLQGLCCNNVYSCELKFICSPVAYLWVPWTTSYSKFHTTPENTTKLPPDLICCTIAATWKHVLLWQSRDMKSCWLPAGVSVQWPKMNSTRNILSNLILGSSNYLLYLCFWSIHSCESNIVVEFWAQLLGRTKYCWNWIDVWSDGLRTIIFWQGWFIPHALRKCPQIVHVKTSEK